MSMMRVTAGFVVLLVFMFSSYRQEKAEWKGTIEVVDGVTIVKNPIEPMYGENILRLDEDLSIGEAEGREEYMFFQLNKIAVSNNGDIYALDIREKHVKVFDKQGEYIKTFGKGGDGPGEFFRPRFIACSSQEKLAVGGVYRISFYSLNGEFFNSVNPTALGLVQFDVDSQGDIISFCMHFRDEFTEYELKKLSPELDEIYTFKSVRKPRSSSNGFNAFGPVLTWTLFRDDKVVCGYPADGYKLEMYDKEGRLEKEIHREYRPEPVSESDKIGILKFLKMEPETKISSPSVKLPFRRVYSDDEGRIFVQTWRIFDNGEGFYYDIFDADGRYLSVIPLKFVPSVFKQRKLYTIEEDDKGYQYIKRYNVTWEYRSDPSPESP